MFIQQVDVTTLAGWGLVLPPDAPDYRWFQIDPDHPYIDDVDLVAFKELQRDPLLLEMRLLHIYEIYFEEDEDQPTAHPPERSAVDNIFHFAVGRLSLDRPAFGAFIDLVAAQAHCSPLGPGEQVTRFRALSADELVRLGVTLAHQSLNGLYYQYQPPKDMLPTDDQRNQHITLVDLPRSPASSKGERYYFQVATFDPRLVPEVNPDPFDRQGVGHMVLDRAGAQDFITLLHRAMLP